MARSKPAHKLSRKYAATLHGYLVLQQETALQHAYELGRQAISCGLGLLDMVRLHQQALAACLARPLSPSEIARTLQAAEVFFLETLPPFEAARRGFDDANRRLQQLNQELERRNAELATLNLALRDLSKQILHVEEEERKRISRELHDVVGQALTAIHIDLDLMIGKDQTDTRILRDGLTGMRGLLQQTMDVVHRFAHELRPAMLDELGLLPALRSYLKTFEARCGLQVHIGGHAGIESLSSEQKTVLFRVAQESLTNVSKHAHAKRVDISLRKFNNAVQMQIKDDGKSFPVNGRLAGKRGKRLGIFGMQERVRLVNGVFALESAPGKGTIVRVEIPLKSDAPHARRDNSPLLPQAHNAADQHPGRSAGDQHHCITG